MTTRFLTIHTHRTPISKKKTKWNTTAEAVESRMKCETSFSKNCSIENVLFFPFVIEIKQNGNRDNTVQLPNQDLIQGWTKVHPNKYNIFNWYPWPLVWVLCMKSEFLVRNISRPCTLEIQLIILSKEGENNKEACTNRFWFSNTPACAWKSMIMVKKIAHPPSSHTGMHCKCYCNS